MKAPLGTGLGPATILAALLLVTPLPGASQMEVQCDRKDATTWLTQPTVDVLVYQGPCNPMLVPGRRSMVRVFLNWKDHEGKEAPPDYHVTATLSGESGPVACKVTPSFPVQVIKQRLYANSQRAKAENSLNFFGCDLDGVGTLTANVAFRERPDVPIHQPRRIAHMSRAEVVRARVVFPTVGSWSSGVPPAAITEARTKLGTGADFAIKNLPIFDVAWRIAEDPVLKVLEPHLDPAVDLDWTESDETWSVEEAPCESLPAETCRTFVETDPVDDDELAPEDWLYDRLSDSGDHLVVAVVPNDFQGGWSGLTRRPRGNLCPPVSANTLGIKCRTPAVIFFRMDMSIETVAHEVGHYLGLPHHEGTLQGGSTREIEGFLASHTAGLNKSFLEGNGDPVASGTLISLMADGKQNPATAPASHFIMNSQYQALQEDLEETPLATTAVAPVAEGAVRLAWAAPAATGSPGFGAPTSASFEGALVLWADAGAARAPARVLVRGRVHRDGRSARLAPLEWTPSPPRPVAEEGSSAIRFLDAQGVLLTSVPVDLDDVVESSHPTVSSSTTSFAMSAEVPEDATTLQLAASDGSILAELGRPEGVGPTVAFVSPEGGGTWTPGDPIQWRVEGSETPVSVYYSPDGGGGWTPLVLGGAGTSLDVSGLDPGPEPMIVVATSDGWNVAADTVRFSVRTEPEPLNRSPAPGDVTRVGADISVSFNTDLDAEALGRAFRLTDGEGAAVDGDVTWSEGARTLRYGPDRPLAHGEEYTVTIAEGLEDLYGNRSRSEYQWSFRVEPDADAPRVAGVFPQGGALAIPVNPAVTVGFTEGVDPGTLDGIQVLDSEGQPVQGSTTWDEASRTALFSPDSPLEGSADYRVSVSTAVTDLAGNAIEAPAEWSFSTVATPGEGPAARMASEGNAPPGGGPGGVSAAPAAAAWAGVALAGPELVLDFLEDAGGDLASSPQRVRGEGSGAGLTARGGFDLGMSLTPARTAGCGFSQSVAMGLQMLAGGRTLEGDVRLSGGPEGVEVALTFDQGTIAARTESPGQVTLVPSEPGTVRVEVRGATFELRLDQGNFACPDLMNFGFTLSDAG